MRRTRTTEKLSTEKCATTRRIERTVDDCLAKRVYGANERCELLASEEEMHVSAQGRIQRYAREKTDCYREEFSYGNMAAVAMTRTHRNCPWWVEKRYHDRYVGDQGHITIEVKQDGGVIEFAKPDVTNFIGQRQCPVIIHENCFWSS